MNFRLAEQPLIRYELLCFAPSWHCNLKCAHCYLPKGLRSRDNYSQAIGDRFIQNLPKSIRVVALTGGEPFLHPRRLIKLMHKLSQRGVLSSVVTNAQWVRNQTHCEKMLLKAYKAGLRAISVSLDSYHQPQLAPHQMISLLDKAQSMGMAINLRGIGKRARELIKEVERTGVFNNQENSVSLSNLANTGTASSLAPDIVNIPTLDQCMSLRYPTVNPNGDVFACCTCFARDIGNSILYRGNMMDRNLIQILDGASRDYILAALMVLGPKEINRLAGGPIRPRNPSRCQLCISILNNPENIDKIAHKIDTDKSLRKEIAGRMLVYEACYKPEFLPQIVV